MKVFPLHKFISRLCLIGVSTSLLAASASASLLSRGEGMFYDPNTNLTWLHAGALNPGGPLPVYGEDDVWGDQGGDLSGSPFGDLLGGGSGGPLFPSLPTRAAYNLGFGFPFSEPYGHMTWPEAAEWADGVTFRGLTEWRLPENEVMVVEVDGSYLEDQIYWLVSNVDGEQQEQEVASEQHMIWTSVLVDGENAQTFDWFTGEHGQRLVDSTQSTWAVHEGDVAVSEPATLALLGLGLLSTVLVRIRQTDKK